MLSSIEQELNVKNLKTHKTHKNSQKKQDSRNWNYEAHNIKISLFTIFKAIQEKNKEKRLKMTKLIW